MAHTCPTCRYPNVESTICPLCHSIGTWLPIEILVVTLIGLAIVAALVGAGFSAYNTRTIVFGPQDGVLERQENLLAAWTAPVELRDFDAEATFYNPPLVTNEAWDYGFIFRSNEPGQYYRLIITSQPAWLLIDHDNGSITYLAGGAANALDTDEGRGNRIMLIAKDKRGELYINDELVATFDLSGREYSGRIGVASGYWAMPGVDGVSVRYEDFMIRTN